MQIALINPLIPQNTGNIARLCAGTNTQLHLVGELGFSLDDRYLKRAGLDYWPAVQLTVHELFAGFQQAIAPARCWYFSAHAERCYSDVRFDYSDVLVFGAETIGLPPDVRELAADRMLRIPTNANIRCLNLANSVSIALYEALRQCDFPDKAVLEASHPAAGTVK